MENLLIGKRIKLVTMPDDPSPIEAGTTGTITAIHTQDWGQGRWTQYHVKWDNGRTLSLCVPPDQFEVIP